MSLATASLALASICPGAAAAPSLKAPAAPLARAVYAPGEVIVRFARDVTPAERRRARRGGRVAFDAKLALARAELVDVDGSVQAAIRRLERQPSVAYAQPNYRYEALAVEPPDDPFFEQLWGLEDPAAPDPGVSALEAWEDTGAIAQVEGAGQLIAILDTGVDLTHPDLAPNLWVNAEEASGDEGVDDDGNERVDDVHGYDFVDGDGDPDDYEFHGTHVAGTAAAVADNAEGIAGVAPKAQVMAVRVLDGDGGGFTADIADGIAYAAEEGADVINLSLGGAADPEEDLLTEDAIQLAGAEDAVVVAAAGNEAANNDEDPHTPCALPQTNLICVAAINRNGALSGFSNYGVRSVDIAAPGGGDIAGGGILSAKADYGAPLLEDDFESGFGTTWETATSPEGIGWALDAAGENDFATDSLDTDYAPEAISALFTPDEIDLTSERGCRVHFKAKYEIEEFFDAFQAGAFSEGPTEFDILEFDGTSSGYPGTFVSEQVSISKLDGENDVRLLFRIVADELEERDGAYVDDVELICRDDEYDATNYVRFSGTSMATPHVSGVVALVRAAAPGLTALEAIDAILTGASAIPVLSETRRTATEGIVDACQAIAVATNNPDPLSECPGSSENVIPSLPPGPDPGPQQDTPIGPGEPPPPAADRNPPQTFFRLRPPRLVLTPGSRAKLVFRFGADEPDAVFLCRVDRSSRRPCPQRFVRRFRLGPHVVRVFARDGAGNVDPTPAVHRFRVQRQAG